MFVVCQLGDGAADGRGERLADSLLVLSLPLLVLLDLKALVLDLLLAIEARNQIMQQLLRRVVRLPGCCWWVRDAMETRQ